MFIIGCEGDLAATSVIPLVMIDDIITNDVDLADLAG
jgi:hypothetical protein